MAGLSALGELDIKKVVALSTLSQLGFMFITLGLGLPLIAFFHLLAHAYFKAMLFMGAGGVIHRISEYQDLRIMGQGAKSLPLSIGVFLVANISLCGLPFITGFYSKDLILELIMAGGANLMLFLLALISTSLTTLYSVRAIKIIFFRGVKIEAAHSLDDGDKGLNSGMLLLFLPTVAGGLGLSWAFNSHEHLIFIPS